MGLISHISLLITTHYIFSFFFIKNNQYRLIISSIVLVQKSSAKSKASKSTTVGDGLGCKIIVGYQPITSFTYVTKVVFGFSILGMYSRKCIFARMHFQECIFYNAFC